MPPPPLLLLVPLLLLPLWLLPMVTGRPFWKRPASLPLSVEEDVLSGGRGRGWAVEEERKKTERERTEKMH